MAGHGRSAESIPAARLWGDARGMGRDGRSAEFIPAPASPPERAKLRYLVPETAEAPRLGTGNYILKLATYKTTKAAEANQHVDICLIEK